MRINEEFEIHDTLNPKLFDVKSKLMLPDVRKKIIEIVAEFEDYIYVPIHILDIQCVGSNVSYNYTAKSDLDVHIIANFKDLEADEELLQALYDAKKTSFNKELDITIKGIEVEMYVQSVESATISNGIYSICENKWIKEPKPIKSVTKHNVDKDVERWGHRIAEVIESKDYDEITKAINTLYLIRHNSIAADGEWSIGNEIFKTIRNKGWLQALKDASSDALSKKLSLESYKGAFVNRYEESE